MLTSLTEHTPHKNSDYKLTGNLIGECTRQQKILKAIIIEANHTGTKDPF